MTILHFHGSAFGVYSQLGYLDREHKVDSLRRYASFRGSSSGAMAALVASYGLRGGGCLEVAVRLAHERGHFAAPWSYLGKVHDFTADLLKAVLAGARQQKPFTVIATHFPSGKPMVLRPAWNDPLEAIRACQASMHIPMVCSRAPWIRYGDKRTLDGALHRPPSDPSDDVVVVRARGRLKLPTPDQIWTEYGEADVYTVTLRRRRKRRWALDIGT